MNTGWNLLIDILLYRFCWRCGLYPGAKEAAATIGCTLKGYGWRFTNLAGRWHALSECVYSKMNVWA